MSNFGIFDDAALQIWSCHVTQEANLKKVLLFPNFEFNIGKSCKFLVEKLSTSEVISLKARGGVETPPPPVLLGLTSVMDPAVAPLILLLSFAAVFFF